MSSLLVERARTLQHYLRERSRGATPGRTSASHKRPARRGISYGIESLEQRMLLTGTWTPLTHTAPASIAAAMLLTDGRVLAQDSDTANWYILTPDAQGHYVNATWSPAASMHSTRLYYSSDVLQDGRVFIAGAEYGTGGSNGEIYNPATNTWTTLPAQSFGTFVDSMSTLLPDGRVLIDPVSPKTAGATVIYDPTTNTWSAGPTLFRGATGDEEGWVKLPDGSLLDIDSNSTSERYIPSLNKWVNDAAVPTTMFDSLFEIGPGVLLNNGKVFWVGSTGHTVIYTPSGTNAPGSFSVGPSVPGNLGVDDGPATVLPDGNVIFLAGPLNSYNGPTSFFMYNPSTNSISAVKNAPSITDPPFVSRFLSLPDGTTLMTNYNNTVYDYNPNTTPIAAAVPTLANIAKNANGTYTATGALFNGINQGSAYGDDAQMDTNYPIVKLTSGTNVYYATSFGWNNTGVATGSAAASTNFTLPQGLPLGIYAVQIVANGVASNDLTLVTRPGAIPTLVFTQQPTSAIPHHAIAPAFTVTVEDQFGDIYVGDTSNVTISLGAGPGTVGGTLTVAAVNGVATFSNVSLSAAGGYTLAASDPSYAVSNVLSAPFTILPGPTQLVFTTQPGNSVSGQPITGPITVTIENSDGSPANSDANVTLSIFSGPGTMTGTLTVAAVNGVATFSDATIIKTGAYVLQADDAQDVLTGFKSNSFGVHSAASAQLVFTQQPSTVIAGVPIGPSVTLMIEDQFGNVATSDNSNVTITAVGPGIASGTTTVPAVGGVATFSNLVLTTAGNYTLSAADVEDGFVGILSSSFRVNAGAATHLSFVQGPTTISAGTLFSPAITGMLTDNFGNAATNDTANVTISAVTGPGSVIGTATVQPANGTVTFSNLTVYKPGTYTLQLTNGNVTSAPSASFNVNLGPAAKLAYVQQPSVIASTSTFGVSMMVEDIAGNFLPTDNSSVHLAIVGGPVNGQLGGTFTTNAVNGIVTFNKVSLYQNTGLFTLSASLPGAVANYSAPIIVTSTPVRLVIAQQPSPDATSGHTLSPIIVQILDASGLVAHDNSHVTVTLVNPKGATLGGTKTVTATNGVATFSDLSISKPGTYTLKMTDGTLGPATTRTITVVAPGVVRATTTSLVASRSSVLSGQSLTLTATANPGGSLPARTGTITFFDGSTQIGTAIALDANSTASITITPTGAGVHHYKVVYSGDTNYKGSTSKVVNVKVNPLLIPLVWLDK